ncbi:MAG: hypothetical protein ABSG13_01625 [Bryobacteraceae bacterium]|jgi:hypothetical protein
MEEAISVFQRFGYDANEAGFLALAAIHSGYFVRRQFAEFLGQERGGNAQRFIEKLLQKRHATFTRYHLNKFVYHIRAKKIYNRLGQTDNRNRRDKAPLTLKRKLMCLDFVLAHRGKRFLETESEKVAYFASDREIPVSALPVRRYVSHNSSRVTDRYFVDKLPIFVDGDPTSPGAPPVVHFAYVDEGAETLQGFGTFLKQYGSLFSALKTFEVVYVGATGIWFGKAALMFAQIARDSIQIPFTPEELELRDYFEIRRKFEAKDFAGLDTDRIVRYRDEKRQYAEAAYEELFRRWLVEGDSALNRRKPPSGAAHRSFRTMLVPHDYDILGGIERAS